MMNELRGALTGATTAADVNTALDTFFDPGGTFETTIYQGSNNGLSPMQLSETESASVDIKATDQAFRDILKPMAMAAIATDSTLALSGDVQVELLAQSGRDLLGAQTTIVEMRASLGALEGRIEETVARNSAEITSTQLGRLELVGVDEFETATKYESVRGQLESLYAITARSQRLSLAEYL
jgi:flagellar hook-associated protein 3 FlgL